MKIDHKDFIWLGAIALIIIGAYAVNMHANAQAAANDTPQLGTSPNYVEAQPAINLTMPSYSAPVFATVSAPSLNFQVQSFGQDFANINYQMPTIPSFTPATSTSSGSPLTMPESPPSFIQQLADPLGIFS